MQVPEILAPAGSMEALKAAVINGADAVYLGGKLFNARQYAANFDDHELVDAVRLAHMHNVKVYVTVNILLHNEELEKAVKYLKFLYNAGADGIIVQDLGLLYLAREAVPQLKLHASTQMTVHNLPGAQFFVERGLERVVLARELSLKDISRIRQGCNVELEVFVHGALCICYSGQCLMSSLIGGRSGNRGRCAQPCRLPYQLVESTGKPIEAPGDYLLSPKDLWTIDILPELVASGVHSLKFEGRMKRPEYVATVIRIYKEALERCLDDPQHFFVTKEEKRQLAQIFNRDFSEAYYKGNPGASLISYQRPNNRGVYLGRIVSIDAETGFVTVKLEQPLSLGDGIEFWVSRGGRTGLIVKEIQLAGTKVSQASEGSLIEIEAPSKVRLGDRIFKTHDAILMEKARSSFRQGFQPRKIPISMKIIGTLGEPLQLLVQDDKGNRGFAETDFRAEAARKRPLTREVLEEQLSRLGNTIFTMEKLELDLSGNLMVPLSELNFIRRQAIAQLEIARTQTERPPIDNERYENVVSLLKRQGISRVKRVPQLVVAVGEPRSIEVAVEGGANYIYISGEHFRGKRFTLKDYVAPIIKAKSKGIKTYYSISRLWLETNSSLMEVLAKNLTELPIDGLLVGNPGALNWAKERFPKLPIVLDYPFNLLNDFSVLFVAEENIQGVTLSPELTFQEIAKLNIPTDLELEGLIHGALPLMVSEHCTVGSVVGHRTAEDSCSKPCLAGKFGLRDRKNYVFPVEMDQFCRMHIFNPQDLCLIDALPQFFELGYHRIRIEARKETPEYVRQVAIAYRKALDDLGRRNTAKLGELKEELGQLNAYGLTKGHYFRGV